MKTIFAVLYVSYRLL